MLLIAVYLFGFGLFMQCNKWRDLWLAALWPVIVVVLSFVLLFALPVGAGAIVGRLIKSVLLFVGDAIDRFYCWLEV
jgi:hypothetical protein